MNHRQHPIGSPFTAASTADDVLAGIDLSGKNAIVTGGHAGLGYETTRALAKAGASVTVASRDPERARRAIEGLGGVEFSQLDLVDPKSIDAFAARWLTSRRPLHILINNAAAVPKGLMRDARGYELQFATSHLGHFQLTRALLEALKAAEGARVINVSSGAHRFGEIRWEDPSFEHSAHDSRAAYAQAKKANVLFAVELDRRHAKDKIRAFAVHPGVVVGTGLNNSAGPAALRAMGLIDEAGTAIIDPERGKKTLAQGASTICFAATSPLLASIGGVYLVDNDISRLDDEKRTLTADRIPVEATTSSIDPQAAQRLWELSERMLA